MAGRVILCWKIRPTLRGLPGFLRGFPEHLLTLGLLSSLCLLLLFELLSAIDDEERDFSRRMPCPS